MSPSRDPEPVPNFARNEAEKYTGPPRNIAGIDALEFAPNLQPKNYEMKGTHPDSKILFTDVNILDSTGRDPYRGDVLIEGEKIVKVGTLPKLDELEKDPKVRVFRGRGRTLMSGLGDAHTHFSWNGGDLNHLGELGVEEHTLLTARSALCFLDSGYTMCYGAASAKERLDVVIRNAINASDIPGPRSLANGKEMAKRDKELVAGMTAFADGPDEMRKVIRHLVDLGVDQIKLSMSGEEITEIRSAQDCYFDNLETAACVDEAHSHGVRVCAHAIAPAINWLIATLNDAHKFGYTHEKAEKVGYQKELTVAVRGLKEMHRRGITILPGGDYGFAWTPHGTYARDLAHFVNFLGFTPMEAIISATAGVAKLFMRPHELGKIQEGFYADCLLVDGNPLENIEVLQDHDRLSVIIINGRVHKAGKEEYVPPPIAG